MLFYSLFRFWIFNVLLLFVFGRWILSVGFILLLLLVIYCVFLCVCGFILLYSDTAFCCFVLFSFIVLRTVCIAIGEGGLLARLLARSWW